jgi:hypothetical protein
LTEQTITNADDTKLIGLIDGAQRRVLYVAPGISEPVAKALIEAQKKRGTKSVQAILDPDPEVMRLGYGTIEGLRALSDADRFLPGGLLSHPGLRIGLLVADDATLVFSPRPLLIESESVNPARPNAILLGKLPAEVAAEVGLDGTATQHLGTTPLTAQAVGRIEQDLKAAPPVAFDLARRVRVFTSRFQFVELEMTGCFVSRKKVSIPADLVGLADTDDVERQFHAQFDLVRSTRLEVKGPTGQTISEETLREHRRRIEKKFLVVLPGYGTVVLRANKTDFQAAVATLEDELEAFSAGVRRPLEEQMERSKHALVEALLPAITHRPPPHYMKLTGPHPSKTQLGPLLEEEISNAFGSAAELVTQMRVKWVFKDVAYESLVDPRFLEVARRAMPGVGFLHREFDAAPEDER